MNKVYLKHWIGVLLILFFGFSVFFLSMPFCMVVKPFFSNDSRSETSVRFFYPRFLYKLSLNKKSFSYVPEQRNIFLPQDTKDCNQYRKNTLIVCQVWYLLHFLSMGPISKDLYLTSPLSNLEIFSNIWHLDETLYIELQHEYLDNLMLKELDIFKTSIEKTLMFNLQSIKKIVWLDLS